VNGLRVEHMFAEWKQSVGSCENPPTQARLLIPRRGSHAGVVGSAPHRRCALLLALFMAGACAGGASSARAVLVEITDEAGIPLPSLPPPDGTYHMPEVTAGGVGFFDFDGDGDLDLLHVRTPLPGGDGASIENRLYRQESLGRFVDITREAGLAEPGYGQGMAIGDVENDGDPDVYVTNYGPDHFFRNDGNGTFTRATQEAGLQDPKWSTGAAFLDYDADGFLDLYVAHYLRYDPEKICLDPRDRQEYCGPLAFAGAPDRLHHNRGDGTFSDVTERAGIVLPENGARATSMGVLCTDLTGDGRQDVFVANDAQCNNLWVNQGDGTFREEAILRGLATDPFGHVEAGMGIATGDADGDGAPDLFVTHLWGENNRLFLGGNPLQYVDGTAASRLSEHDLERTAWGCAFFDLDHDGDQDLALTNGAVKRRPPLPGAPAGMWSEYAEPNQLLENDGTGRFELFDERAGTFASRVEVNRGLALGDVDGDGDLDLALCTVGNALRLFRNVAPPRGAHWVMVRALTRGRDALGAQMWVEAGGRRRFGAVLAGSSYLSSNDPRAHFGLGPLDALDAIEVLWPDGRRERFPAAGVDRVITLRQGEGQAL
jgi:hypothetical protein